MAAEEDQVIDVARFRVAFRVLDRHPEKGVETDHHDFNQIVLLAFKRRQTDLGYLTRDHRGEIEFSQIHHFDVDAVHYPEAFLLVKSPGPFHFIELPDQRFEGCIIPDFFGDLEEILVDVGFEADVVLNGPAHVVDDVRFHLLEIDEFQNVIKLVECFEHFVLLIFDDAVDVNYGMATGTRQALDEIHIVPVDFLNDIGRFGQS